MRCNNSSRRGSIAITILAAAGAMTGCGGTAGSGEAVAGNMSASGAGASGKATMATYTVSATVTGLSGSGLTLELNGGQSQAVAADGTVTFPSGLTSGSSYAVTVASQPTTPREICGVANGSGAIAQANVTSVAINCSIVIGFLYQTFQYSAAQQASDQPGQLLSYGISSGTGALVPFGSALPTSPLPTAVVASPDKRFVIVSASSSTLSVYAVNYNTGALTASSAVVTADFNPNNMVMSGSFLFVSGPYLGTPALETYALDETTGTLTPTGTPLTFDAQSGTSLAATPDGKFLYVLNGDFDSNTPAPVTLTAYAIDAASGALTAGPVLTWMTTWSSTTAPQNAMTMDPLGRFLYLQSYQGNTIQQLSTVLPYAIDAARGALTAIGTGTSIASNAAPLAPDPTGRYLYTVDELNSNNPFDNGILALAVGQSSGVVSQLGSTLSLPGPNLITCDPSGQFVYATESGQATPSSPVVPALAVFTIGTAPSTAGQLVPGAQTPSPGETSAMVIIE